MPLRNDYVSSSSSSNDGGITTGKDTINIDEVDVDNINEENNGSSNENADNNINIAMDAMEIDGENNEEKLDDSIIFFCIICYVLKFFIHVLLFKKQLLTNY